MPIIFQKVITRDDLRNNPNKYYVFGDNVRRKGYGGQAKAMRGEPNAIGVVTKWAPDMQIESFFNDGRECQILVESDLYKIDVLLRQGKTIVVPEDGIGTGLSRLPEVAPNLHEFITDWFYKRKSTSSRPSASQDQSPQSVE